MSPSTLDAAASAIASEPRRRVLERLAQGDATVTDLAGLLEVSVPATLKHVDRLSAGGLIRRQKVGRVVTVSLVPGGLDGLVEWAGRTRLFWDNHLDRYASHLGAPAARSEGAPRA